MNEKEIERVDSTRRPTLRSVILAGWLIAAASLAGCGGGGDGTGSSPPPPPPTAAVCGNGVAEDGEACDRGEANLLFAFNCPTGAECCSRSCGVIHGPDPVDEVCGDGTRQGAEQCDAGDANVAPGGCATGQTCCTTECKQESGAPSSNGARTLVVAATDFQVLGVLSTIDVETHAVRTRVEDVSSDPVVRVFGDRIYVVNRLQFDNLQIVDASGEFPTLAQFSTENGSNPHDVLVDGNVAFITRYEPPFNDVAVMNLTTGAIEKRIDMLPYADTGGAPSMLPRPHEIVRVGGLLYVLLQQLDASFSVAGDGTVAIIDPAARSVIGTIPLGARNPATFGLLGVDLLIPASGLFMPPTLSGGLVRVSTAERASRSLLDDDVAGGNLSGLAVVSDSKAYLLVAKPDANGVPANVNAVVTVDPRTGSLGPTVFTCDGYAPEIAFNGGDRLAIACRDPRHPGVTILDTGTDEIVAGPLDTLLPPFSMAFLP